MAFSSTGWAAIGGNAKRGNAPVMYSYSTADTIADVNNAGYFNDLSDTLEVGDLIYCVTSTGSPPGVHTFTQVVSNASGVVDVADGTTLAATDSD